MRKRKKARVIRLDGRKPEPRPETRDPDKDVTDLGVTDEALLNYLFSDIEEARK
ncbi:MAG: hypothetical protein ACE1Z4_03630 [Gammaproteobacteria bacterium]